MFSRSGCPRHTFGGLLTTVCCGCQKLQLRSNKYEYRLSSHFSLVKRCYYNQKYFGDLTLESSTIYFCPGTLFSGEGASVMGGFCPGLDVGELLS